MRPVVGTPAHCTDLLAELVCSNSFRASAPTAAAGALKRELELLDSLVIRVARESAVPSGRSLGVDRELFARRITEAVSSHPRIRVVRGEVTALPEPPAIVASGPLTSAPLARDLRARIGVDHLHFFDAIAPIVDAETLAPGGFFSASRYGEGEDYLNVPLTEEQYLALVGSLAEAESRCHVGEDRSYFEGCLPIEVMARRGTETARFGPLKPVGLTDPATGRRPHAVIQLRREDLSGRLYNLVGFQTQLSIPDQERILRAIPAFRDAVFVRHGAAHRNTFVNGPAVLASDLSLRTVPGLRLAGQVAGVEGYIESTACGLLAALFALHKDLPPPPPTTICGGLLKYITSSGAAPFQPMKANWGLVDEIPGRKDGKKERLAERSFQDLQIWTKLLVS